MSEVSPGGDAAPTSPPFVRVSDIVKRYGDGAAATTALCGLSLTLRKGDFLALIGRSGSGKTTLLNMIGGLDRPTSGRVEVGGHEITRLDDEALTLYRRDTVGFIFQFFQLLPTLSAAENVALPLWLAGRGRDEHRAKALLDRVGLRQREGALPHQLSGGEQQRVAIARALVNTPRLLLADEPTGNLDRQSGRTVLELLHQLADEEELTVVMATHSREASEGADRVLPLADGKLDGSAA